MPPLVSPVATSSGGSQDPASPDISRVLPVFILSTLVERGAWPGPHSRLPARGLALGWAEVVSADTVQPVLAETSQTWDAQGIDWRTRALENLREHLREPWAPVRCFAKWRNLADLADYAEDWVRRGCCSPGAGTHVSKGLSCGVAGTRSGVCLRPGIGSRRPGAVENLIERSYSGSDSRSRVGIFEPDDLAA